MKRMKDRLNNRGISLVELLVALAVGAIVISALTVLITQGIKQYNKHTVMTQLQEDADIALNNISNSVMEANFIVISNSNVNTTFQTSSSARGGNNVVYQHKDGCLYMGTSVADSDSMGLLCKNVKEFKIDVVSTSLKTQAVNETGTIQHKVLGINNPVQLKVTIKLEFNGITREASRVSSVRNRLSSADMTMQGFLFSNAPYMEQFDSYIAYD